jgi:hypothetical protein
MCKISLVFWRMVEFGILLSIFTDLYKEVKSKTKSERVKKNHQISGIKCSYFFDLTSF